MFGEAASVADKASILELLARTKRCNCAVTTGKGFVLSNSCLASLVQWKRFLDVKTIIYAERETGFTVALYKLILGHGIWTWSAHLQLPLNFALLVTDQ